MVGYFISKKSSCWSCTVQSNFLKKYQVGVKTDNSCMDKYCVVLISFKNTYGGSYNRTQLHSSIWWVAYFLEKHQVEVTIENSCMVHYCVVIIFLRGIWWELQ